MIRSFLTVSTGTLASRLLGFIRDSMLAALLGAGPLADAFLLAFQLVNVIRRLLTEGALNAALVPAWLRVREGEGAVIAAAFAGRVLGTVSAALIAAAVLIGLLMPLLMTALAPGFAGHSILLLGGGGSAARPVRISFNAEMRTFLGKASRGMMASSAPQLLVIAGAVVASSSPAAVTWLYFANRLIEMPLGIVGITMGTVLVPELTRALRAEDATALARAQSRGLGLAVGFAL